MSHLTPLEIVTELNRHIVGQTAAKQAVAIALRNRWRRQQVSEKLRQEILPKNILMIGPTGVGKTEIARRLAKLAQAPFIKVEATKFTEVGYVGRDVEQIIRDLVDMAIHQSKQITRLEVTAKAQENAEKRILDALVGKDATPETREKFHTMLQAGSLDSKEIEIELTEHGSSSMPSIDIPGMPGAQLGMLNLGDLLGKSFSKPTKLKRISVKDARDALIAEESEALVDQDALVKEAIQNTENNGIVFLDEIDKICSRSERHEGGVSREGVQRDLLPLIEGTTVSTKHGPVNTDHILFIASGAFHLAKPSDLLPELQGRLPNRVEMNALTAHDFVQILTEPEASLLKQYKALLETEGVTLTFDDASIQKIASLAADINQRVENIGARRLHTLLEKLLEKVSFEAVDYKGQTFSINEEYVDTTLGSLAQNTDLSKFIL